MVKVGTCQPDHIDSHPTPQAIHQRLQHQLWFVIIPEAGIDEIDPQYTDCLLLEMIVIIQHAHMQHQIIGIPVRLQLKANTHPAITTDCTLVVDSCNCIGEHKKIGSRAFEPKAAVHKLILMIQHFIQTRLTDISATGFGSVDMVRVHFIIGRHCLSNGTGSCTCLKKIACYFLTCPDFCEGAIDSRIQVDFQGFLLRLK